MNRTQQSRVTEIVQRPDGGETLVLHTAAVSVIEGPDKGHEFVVDRTRVVIGSGADCGIRLADATVSKHHAEIRPSEAGYLLRDLGSTNGTQVGGLRVGEALIVNPVNIAVGATVLQLHPGSGRVEIPLSARSSFGELIGQSLAMRQVFALLERVAPSDSTVLLEGESGTGKELAALALHEHSPRGDAPFVVVDCGAIPPALIESELFGHERGAFTGARESRRGAFEEAAGGTVFLDEVGELSLELQPTLLRFLERRQFKRVGATRHQTVDVRVVAATNRPLAAEVKAGRFREDLFYRLAVVRVELPSLRDRPEDIPLLAHHFAQQLAPDSRAVVTDEIEALLASYRWPGNVRQLRHLVEQLTVVPELATQTLREQPLRRPDPPIGKLTELPFHEGRRRWQEIFDRQYLAAQLEQEGGVIARAAERAGLPRQTFHRLWRRFAPKP